MNDGVWLVDFVKSKEGFRSKPYLDAVGVPTIGYGNTYYTDGTRVAMTDVSISKSEAEILLAHSLNDFLDYVIMYEHDNGYDWNNKQRAALTSWCYNLGKSRLRRLTNNGTRDNTTIAEKMRLYHKAGGKVLKGLVIRRNEEADYFLS